MRILFAGSRPGFPERANGAAVSTHHLAGILARNGAAVHILCGKAADGDAPSRAAPDQSAASPYTIERAAQPVAALHRTVAAFSPDLAVLSTGATGQMARLLGERGIPVVVYQRDLGFELLRDVQEAGGDFHLGVFSCSRFVAEELRRRTGLDAVFLPNVFPRERYAVPARGRMVTFVNPVPEKGVDLALALAARHRDLPFLFVEGWTLPRRRKALLRRRAAASGNIRWHPRVDDMRAVYGQTRVLLVPSRWKEAWGRVVTEAQISGIPVIASDRGGLPESVGDSGLLLPPDDVEAWSAGLRKVMADEAVWRDLSARSLAYGRRAELDPNWIVAQFVCQVRAWLKQARKGASALQKP